MSRKDFQSDLAEAAIPGTFPRLSDIQLGQDYDTFSFVYTAPFSTQKVSIQVTTIESSDYPRNHQFFAFSDDENSSGRIADVLGAHQPSPGSWTVLQFLTNLSKDFDHAILKLGDTKSDTEQSEDDFGKDFSMYGDTDSDSDASPKDPAALKQKICSDIRAVKAAGYKVGYLGSLLGSVIISIACRVQKLGLSADTLRAWDVVASEYLVLLIRYPMSYATAEQILSPTFHVGSPLLQMHVGLCASYKPSLACALEQFVDLSSGEPGYKPSWTTKNDTGPAFRALLVGNSLNRLLNDHFIKLLRSRQVLGISWTEAEELLQNAETETGKRASECVVVDSWSCSTPPFLKADHLVDKESADPLVLPLIAMQFTLRRFVRCTEYCLNCFRRVDSGFEAIKPFVCSNGLCLYQYMSLNMGPSLEWELFSQPYVADMLISFTYTRAIYGLLEDFPNDLGLKIPCVGVKSAPTAYTCRYPESNPTSFKSVRGDSLSRIALFVADEGILHVIEASYIKDIFEGDWIVMCPGPSYSSQWHCQVQNIDRFPYITLTGLIPFEKDQKPPTTGKVRFGRSCLQFDRLTAPQKCGAIVTLLRSLPDVITLKESIADTSSGNVSRLLPTWANGLCPAALDLLRWIIASNRSCIMYNDDPADMVSAMDGYLQFRLVQNAPEKEARFLNAVEWMRSQKHETHPTIFAWHGSPLCNWHSILREGLHFKKIINGRSQGNGVYMSHQFNTSIGYTGHGGGAADSWPRSKLNISNAIALNEVINYPEKFVCNSYCYVVDELDWIQPRYLFVKATPDGIVVPQANPAPIYKQHPKRQAEGQSGKLKLPMTALSTHRKAPSTQTGKQKKKGTSSSDMESVLTMAEDRELLELPPEDDIAPFRLDPSATDFRPGTLKKSSLPLLGSPQYASLTATKSLHRHLQEALKVQRTEPLHQLGWYIDPSLLENVYQWIVELHSFDPSLPLARDLRQAGITSIVMEIRFPPHFPMSPPFLRIIRPRLLPFREGGGGHVTAGGSMCMELLTSSGWSPICSMESVFVQVRLALSNLEPNPARLATGKKRDYQVHEAVADYVRVCNLHGWTVPSDLQQVNWK